MPIRIPDGLSFNQQIENFGEIPKGEKVDELVVHLCVWDKVGQEKLPKPEFKVRKLVVLPTVLSKGNDVDAYGAMHAMRGSARTLEEFRAPATPWLLKYFRDTDRTKFTALERAVIDRSLHPSVADALIEILDEIVTANKRGVKLSALAASPPPVKKSKPVKVEVLDESEGEEEVSAAPDWGFVVLNAANFYIDFSTGDRMVSASGEPVPYFMLYRRHYRDVLSKQEMLKDNIVDWFANECLRASGRTDVLLCSVTDFQWLPNETHNSGHQARYAKFGAGKRYVVVPVCYKLHFVLFIIDTHGEQKVVCYDSMKGGATRLSRTHRMLIRLMGFEEGFTAELGVSPDQDDGVSCGVFVCELIRRFMFGRSMEALLDGPAMRKQMRDYLMQQLRLAQSGNPPTHLRPDGKVAEGLELPPPTPVRELAMWRP